MGQLIQTMRWGLILWMGLMTHASAEPRTEIDFDRLDVKGVLTDPIPDEYDGIPRYYDTTGLISKSVDADDVLVAKTLIHSEIETTGATIQAWDSNQSLAVDDLDWAQTYGLYHLLFSSDQKFEERDMRLRSGGERRLVSVRQEAKGIWKVSKSQSWVPNYPKRTAEELQLMYGFRGFENASADWTSEQVAIVADALQILEPRELKYLRGLKWVREQGRTQTSLAGVFRFENFGEGTIQSITLYDKAFKGLPYSFCGTVEKPYSSAHVIIVHELGHLLADQPRMAYVHQLNKTVDEYNVLVGRFNRTQDQSLIRKIDHLQSRIVKLERNPIDGDGPIVEAFLEHRSTNHGPTKYAEFNDVEAFAESYALYKLDPSALRRVDPALYKWFASKAYLELLP